MNLYKIRIEVAIFLRYYVMLFISELKRNRKTADFYIFLLLYSGTYVFYYLFFNFLSNYLNQLFLLWLKLKKVFASFTTLLDF